MNNLRGDLVTRARVCVDCHVGAADKEVNHDLIAAGHPRLNFEFAAFHDLLPRHWAAAQDRALVRRQTGAPFDAALWVVGQVVTARAAASLLASRVERISAKPNEKPWPELSEFDCYACHHPLVAESWRQHTSRARHDGQSKPGMLRPSSWYFAMLGPIREQLAWKDDVPDASTMLNATIGRLDQSVPNLAQIRTVEEALASLERGISASPDGHPLNLSREQIKLLLDHVTCIQGDPAITDWDQVAQAYLAAVPLHTAFRETSGRGTRTTDPRVTALLKQILRALEFPADSQSPSEAQWGDRVPNSRGRSAIKLLAELQKLVEQPTNSRTNP